RSGLLDDSGHAEEAAVARRRVRQERLVGGGIQHLVRPQASAEVVDVRPRGHGARVGGLGKHQSLAEVVQIGRQAPPPRRVAGRGAGGSGGGAAPRRTSSRVIATIELPIARPGGWQRERGPARRTIFDASCLTAGPHAFHRHQMSTRRLRACVLAAVLLWPALTGATDLLPRRVRSDGTWLRDRAGRVVLLRGMDYSGLEFGNFLGAPHGPEEADFAQMASWGVNVIRLPIAWNYLEPSPGVFDRHYLRDAVDPVVRFARRHDIAVVLAFHQFQWPP